MYEKRSKTNFESGRRIMLLKELKTGNLMLNCPHCGEITYYSNYSDLYANEKFPYKEQEEILKHMQEKGFNVVTCPDCGDVILIEK